MIGVAEHRHRPPRGPRRDWGRTLARLVCLVFALVGAIPLTGGVLLRSKPVQEWAANETSRLLRVQLGLEASFSVELSLIPLQLAVNDLSVASKDSGEPAVFAETVAVHPRFFSLLAGRIDVGDISLEDADVRLVVRDGKIQNVAYRSVDTGSDGGLTRAPFRSLSVTNARVDLTVDDLHLVTGGIDIDAIVEKDLSFDVALHAEPSTVVFNRVGPEGQPIVDDDRLCELDLRVFLSREEVLVRRLSFLGMVDENPAAGTFPPCRRDSPKKAALRLSQFKVRPGEGIPEMQGHVLFRGPLALLERFAPRLDTSGWAGFSGEISMDPSLRLPNVSGHVSGENLSLSGFAIAEKLDANVLVAQDVIQIPKMNAQWGNGSAEFTGIQLSPFEDQLPLSIAHVSTREIDMPGVMRDIGLTDHCWVDWNFGSTEIDKVRGTLSPFYIDGAVDGKTKDFTVWNRGYDDPTRRRMVGLARANVKGRFRAHKDALEFYSIDLGFGQSRLPVDLVSVGFGQGPLIVRLKEGGGTLDLADISPIADLSFSGASKLFVDMKGPMKHPVLEGTLSVEDLNIGGFSAGNVEESNVHFEPLFVEFSELKGQKGGMAYQMPRGKLSFDGPSTVEFTGSVQSERFVLQEFFHAFHFDEDPRFDGMAAEGKVAAQVRYLMGGPEDSCGGGRLQIEGSADLESARALGEQYSGGTGAFSLHWFDMQAGLRGMRVSIPQMTLRKGSGTLFATAEVEPGGVLHGNLVGTQIPVSRINALSQVFSQTDGFLTGAGQLGGTLENVAFSADVSATSLKAGELEVPPSSLRLELIPNPKARAQGTKRTGCGRLIPPDSPPPLGEDESEGSLVANGSLFGGQIQLSDAQITRQKEPRLSGRATLNALDVPAMVTLFGAGGTEAPFEGKLSGDLAVSDFSFADPYGSSLRLGIGEAFLAQNGLRIELADKRASLRLKDRKLTSRHWALRATTRDGQSSVVDAELQMDDRSNMKASFDLRPTDLGVLAAALPGIERAAGQLEGSLAIDGYWLTPQVSGFLSVDNAEVKLAGFELPLEHVQLKVGLDGSGMHVTEGSADWGGGKLSLEGSAPLTQGQLGRINLDVAARSVALPIDKGLEAKFNANLNLSVPAPSDDTQELPRLSGNVDILAGSYKKPMSMTADIATLTNRGEKTEVTNYDESKDSVRLDVLLTSQEPIYVENDLVETSLRIDPGGIRVSGTDERFGAVGSLQVDAGGQVFLRRNDFEIQGGLVRFNDPTRLRPEVDVTAVTEYRRYDDQGSGQGDGSSNAASTGTPLAGNWRITMHAYGAPENLKIDLASDPPLAQDDIFLLLTVGLTRTELDQTSNSGVGSSVALEALGSLSGAESAVTKAVPVDEFRFGSTYSSRSGRTEPTVTIGKRLSDRIRASVTTSLSDSSEVRSNVEYRATDNLSVEGSFDNASNVATATGGNLGGDVRWRLEFR